MSIPRERSEEKIRQLDIQRLYYIKINDFDISFGVITKIIRNSYNRIDKIPDSERYI